LSSEEWISVLKLSTLWNFEEARRSAINNLPFTDVDHPVMRIELAMTYKVRQWFLPALQKLATQEHGLKTEDVQRLGLEFALKVAELRGKVQGFERARGSAGSWNMSIPAVPVTDFIKELFPAAIVLGSAVDDSRSWDPMSLCFRPGESGTIPMPDDMLTRPNTPNSTLDMKQDPLLAFQINELASAFDPFQRPTWSVKPVTTLPSPVSRKSRLPPTIL
jgi:hypothetical protein